MKSGHSCGSEGRCRDQQPSGQECELCTLWVRIPGYKQQDQSGSHLKKTRMESPERQLWEGLELVGPASHPILLQDSSTTVRGYHDH